MTSFADFKPRCIPAVHDPVYNFACDLSPVATHGKLKSNMLSFSLMETWEDEMKTHSGKTNIA